MFFLEPVAIDLFQRKGLLGPRNGRDGIGLQASRQPAWIRLADCVKDLRFVHQSSFSASQFDESVGIIERYPGK
jgi:hypothetical protein